MNHNSAWVRRRIDPIAIDFGTRFIRMLQLAQLGDQIEIVGCAQRIVPPEITSPSDYNHFLTQVVSSMLEGGGFVGNKVIRIIPHWRRDIGGPHHKIVGRYINGNLKGLFIGILKRLKCKATLEIERKSRMCIPLKF